MKFFFPRSLSTNFLLEHNRQPLTGTMFKRSNSSNSTLGISLDFSLGLSQLSLFPFSGILNGTRSVTLFQSNDVTPHWTLMSPGRHLDLFILSDPWLEVFTPCFLSGKVIVFQCKLISPLSCVIIIGIPVE